MVRIRRLTLETASFVASGLEWDFSFCIISPFHIQNHSLSYKRGRTTDGCWHSSTGASPRPMLVGCGAQCFVVVQRASILNLPYMSSPAGRHTCFAVSVDCSLPSTDFSCSFAFHNPSVPSRKNPNPKYLILLDLDTLLFVIFALSPSFFSMNLDTLVMPLSTTFELATKITQSFA